MFSRLNSEIQMTYHISEVKDKIKGFLNTYKAIYKAIHTKKFTLEQTLININKYLGKELKTRNRLKLS